jgi:hypothetical protein
MSMKSLFYNDDDWLKETVSGTVALLHKWLEGFTV